MFFKVNLAVIQQERKSKKLSLRLEEGGGGIGEDK